MIQILHGWGRKPLSLSNTRKYWPEELARQCSRQQSPYWLEFDGMHIQLRESDFDLAVQLAAQYHNVSSYNAPDRTHEIHDELFEERVLKGMEEEEDTASDYVTSEEDLVYEDQFYT